MILDGGGFGGFEDSIVMPFISPCDTLHARDEGFVWGLELEMIVAWLICYKVYMHSYINNC